VVKEVNNFRYEICGTDIYDSTNRYVRGCEYYLLEKVDNNFRDFYISILNILDDIKKDNFYKNANFIDNILNS